jgi:GNAT superfamily N-acetyltransferase
MSAPGFIIDTASEADLPAVMDLEHGGFAPEIIEDCSVFEARRATFPAGFLVLRDTTTGRARGYIVCERWARDPGTERAAYLLGHDPAPRYAPTGPVLYTASMTIEPALRGTGLGAQLFREGRARVLNAAPQVRLELLIVHEYWVAARRLYAAEGFSVRAAIPDFFPGPAGCPGASAILMERPVERPVALSAASSGGLDPGERR